MKKSKSILHHVPVLSSDRRFLSLKQRVRSIEQAVEWIESTALCKTFDKNVLPFAFAFAREQAKQSARRDTGARLLTEQDLHVNARLARFMAQDWLESSGAMQTSHHESHVVHELAIVQKWLASIAPSDASDNRHAAWSSASLVPILKWEESSSQKQQTTH
jgi:hypothetical protein